MLDLAILNQLWALPHSSVVSCCCSQSLSIVRQASLYFQCEILDSVMELLKNLSSSMSLTLTYRWLQTRGVSFTFFYVSFMCLSYSVLCLLCKLHSNIRSQSVSGTLDRPRVVAPSKTCGHVRSSRCRWHWVQCRPRSAAPTFDRVVLAGASTPAWCPVYRLRERPQPGVVQSGLVSLSVVAARDQKWRVASDKSGLLSLLCQSG